MSPLNYRAIVWDIDDVLVDTAAMYKISRVHTLQHIGFAPDEIEQAMTVWNRLFWFFEPSDKVGLLRALMHELGRPITEGKLESAADFFMDIWTREVGAVPGMPKLMHELQARGVLQAIASNGKVDWQLHKLRNAGMADIFDKAHIIVTQNHTPEAKPNPYGILKACELLGVEPGDAVYIGDRTTDVVAANLAGVMSIFFDRQPPAPEVRWAPKEGTLKLEKPRYSFKTVEELKKLLLY